MPMMERLGGKFIHRPYAVVLKPSHGKKILSGTAGGFSEKAEYIFRKQLEEAEIILVNRIDELSSEDIDLLESQLAEQYPGRRVIALSAKTGENMDAIHDALGVEADIRNTTMDVDYDVYADGEAELGWLNATVNFDSDGELFALDDLATGLVEQLRSSFLQCHAEPGHLKVLCSSQSDVSVANLIDSESATMLSIASDVQVNHAKAIITARVKMAPDQLTEQVNAAVSAIAKQYALEAITTQLESFRPGRPVPTYRSSI
jgi:Fe2+ transport system protein B